MAMGEESVMFWEMARELDNMERMLVMFPKLTQQKMKKRRRHYNHQEYLCSLFEKLDVMLESTDFILNYCPLQSLMEYKANNLKNQLLLACDLLMSEMTADPLLQCMERMKAIKPATEEAIGTEEDVCVICQDEFVESVGLDIKETECGHRFHGRCVFKWLQSSHDRCPVCRFRLL